MRRVLCFLLLLLLCGVLFCLPASAAMEEELFSDFFAALPEDVKTYLDISLRRFETVFPAVGSAASAIELTCDELEKCCGANFVAWVDVCKGWQEEANG